MRYDAQAVVEPVERAVGVKLAFWRGTGLQQLGKASPHWAESRRPGSHARLDHSIYACQKEKVLRLPQDLPHETRY